MTSKKNLGTISLNSSTREQANEIRRESEKKGLVLSEAEYQSILQYAARKVLLNHKEESYILLLLEDEIKNYFFRNAINAMSMAIMAGI